MSPRKNDRAKVLVGPVRYQDRWGIVERVSNSGLVTLRYPKSHRKSRLVMSSRDLLFNRRGVTF